MNMRILEGTPLGVIKVETPRFAGPYQQDFEAARAARQADAIARANLDKTPKFEMPKTLWRTRLNHLDKAWYDLPTYARMGITTASALAGGALYYAAYHLLSSPAGK